MNGGTDMRGNGSVVCDLGRSASIWQPLEVATWRPMGLGDSDTMLR
jgi:hypothetical protein